AQGSRPRGSRAVLDLGNGSFGYDENGLTLERGDSLRWVRAEAVTGSRGAVGGLEISGRHLWGADGVLRRGPHEVTGSFAQRGYASRLAGGDEEGGSGESGDLGYAYRSGPVAARLGVARGYDHRESLGDLHGFSRRDAQATRIEGEASRALGSTDL